jgi:hypothetical protein
MEIDAVWLVIAAIGLGATLYNLIQAGRAIHAVQQTERDDKAALIMVAYAKLFRHLLKFFTILFNFLAGAVVAAFEPSELRAFVTIAFLIASAATLTVLEVVEAVRDDP